MFLKFKNTAHFEFNKDLIDFLANEKVEQAEPHKSIQVTRKRMDSSLRRILIDPIKKYSTLMQLPYEKAVSQSKDKTSDPQLTSIY